jgi:hypothetical protein
MRKTHHGLRGVMYLLALLAVLAAGIAGANRVSALHATASHAVPHIQLADGCPPSGARCP